MLQVLGKYKDKATATSVKNRKLTFTIFIRRRKMYADEVESFDPRLRPAASTSAYPESTPMDTDMDVEMEEEEVKPIPTGPKAGTRGKGNGRGRGNGRGGLANSGQRLVEPVTSSSSTGSGSLMDRLSGGGGGAGNSRNASNLKSSKGAAGMAGLLGRMN